MAKKYLDYSGLSYFWAQIKSLWVQDVNYDSSTHQVTKTKAGTTGNVVAIPYKTSDLTNDSGYITSADVPEGSSASTVTPKMDGTANKGTDNGFARGDHVHPTDTSRAASTHSHGNIASNGIVSGEQTIANGDRILIADVSGAYGVEKSTIAFDGSTTTKALSQKGTWETFSKDGEPNVLEGVQVNGTDLTITSKKVNIPLASTTSAGVMSTTDKSKLDSISMTNGVIDSSVLPSFVDDVIEAYARSNQTELGSTWLATGSASGTVITPETGKIYVLMNNSTSYSANSQFRWGGTAYVKLSDGGVSSITNGEIDTILAS